MSRLQKEFKIPTKILLTWLTLNKKKMIVILRQLTLTLMVNGLEAIQIDRDIAILWLNDWIDSDSN